jgi:AbrB family looped-hinge helix DNA binding protein
MSEKGQIVVPKETRDERGFEMGSTFAFLVTKSGALVFRPTKEKPRLTLFEHLRKFQGVQIPERVHHCPPRV